MKASYPRKLFFLVVVAALVLTGWATSAPQPRDPDGLHCAVLPASEQGAQRAAPPDDPWQKAVDESVIDVPDQPGLPRVLLIGDSISMYYTVPTRDLLRGKANLHRVPTNGGNTEKGLAHLSEWLGSGKWDVIHFNWGLHDLVVKDQSNAVPVDRYERNLRELVRRLNATGATLIWATTTPVPPRIKIGPERRNADALAYNAAALRIMKENRIQIDDLYEFALPRLREIQLEDDVHFSFEGSRVLAQRVADVILDALRARPRTLSNP